MKTTKIFAFQFLALAFVLCLNVSAQQSTSFSFDQLTNITPANTTNPRATPHVSAYVANPYEARNDAWWNALESEVSLENKHYKTVSVESLQNAIFFQKNHKENVNLSSSTTTLLDIYQYHKSEGMRIMAVAALVEIGDAESLKTVEKKLYKQRTESVRSFTIAALQEYLNN